MRDAGLKRVKYGKDAILAPVQDPSKEADSRISCPLDERPSDAEAVKNGFRDGREWYMYSAAGTLEGDRARLASRNFEALQCVVADM